MVFFFCNLRQMTVPAGETCEKGVGIFILENFFSNTGFAKNGVKFRDDFKPFILKPFGIGDENVFPGQFHPGGIGPLKKNI